MRCAPCHKMVQAGNENKPSCSVQLPLQFITLRQYTENTKMMKNDEWFWSRSKNVSKLQRLMKKPVVNICTFNLRKKICLWTRSSNFFRSLFGRSRSNIEVLCSAENETDERITHEHNLSMVFGRCWAGDRRSSIFYSVRKLVHKVLFVSEIWLSLSFSTWALQFCGPIWHQRDRSFVASMNSILDKHLTRRGLSLSLKEVNFKASVSFF